MSIDNRRPLASRQTRWAQALANALAKTRVTPNQVSAASMVMALIAGACFTLVGYTQGGSQITALVVAALFCQLRLLCNLLDGMLAVEAGRGSSEGPFWNEAPDRVADMVILVGAGFGAGAVWLGWAAATFAIGTAYLRAFGQSLGQPADFGGPMAKQHRMALMTGAALLAALGASWIDAGFILMSALIAVVLGTALTCWRRAERIRNLLRNAQAPALGQE